MILERAKKRFHLKKVKNLGLGVIKFIGNGLLRRLGNQYRACPLHVSEEIAIKREVILSLKRCLSTHLVSSLQIDGGKHRNSDRTFSWASKSLWMVTAFMKLKDTCFLEEKL